MKKVIITLIVFSLFFATSIIAQPSGPGGGPGGGDPPVGDPVGIPIDGGAGILLLIGSALGARKIIKSAFISNKRN